MRQRYRLSPSASRQLDNIYVYTRERWGDAQARKYLTELFDHFERIGDGTLVGAPIPEAYGVQGHFARCGRHFIYWRVLSDGCVGIAEILHERMNLGDRLAASASLVQSPEDD